MDKVTVASAQLQFRLRSTIEECRDDLYRFARAAEAKGARVLLFPARAGLMVAAPLVRDRRFRLQLRSAAGQRQSAGLWQRVSGSAAGWMAQAFRTDLPGAILGEFAADSAALQRAYVELFGRMASTFGVTVVAPSAILPEASSGEVRHTTLVFGPGGDVIGRQSQVKDSAQQMEGVAHGQTWEVISTEIGRLGILIGEDVLIPEAARILALQGAEILLVQGATSAGEFPACRAAALARMQENSLYMAASYLIGEDPLRRAGASAFMGQAGVFAPRELTPRGDGVLVEMGGAQAEGIVTAEWDGNALRALWQVLPEEVRPGDAAHSAEAIAALYLRARETPALPVAPPDHPSTLTGVSPVTVSPAAASAEAAASQSSAGGKQAQAVDLEPLHDLAELPVLGSVISRWPLEVNEVSDSMAVTEAVTDWSPARAVEAEGESESPSTIRRDDETDEMEAVPRVEEASAPDEGDEAEVLVDEASERAGEAPTESVSEQPTSPVTAGDAALHEAGDGEAALAAGGSESEVRPPAPSGREPQAGPSPEVASDALPPDSSPEPPPEDIAPPRPVG